MLRIAVYGLMLFLKTTIGVNMGKLLAAVLLAMTVAGASAEDKIAIQNRKTLSAEGGRYVFGQVSDFRSDQFMLDTKTGRLWSIAEKSVPRSNDPKDGTYSYRILQDVPYNGPLGKETLEPPASKN